METFDKTSIASVVALIQNRATATKKKIISELFKDPSMRRIAKAILDTHERGKKEAAAPKAPEGAESKARREPRTAEPWIDPERTKDWLKR